MSFHLTYKSDLTDPGKKKKVLNSITKGTLIIKFAKLKVNFYLIYLILFFHISNYKVDRLYHTFFLEFHSLYYNMQKWLCHAQIIVAYFTHFVYAYVFMNRILLLSPISLLQLISWPSYFVCIIAFTMIEGVINLSFPFLF